MNSWKKGYVAYSYQDYDGAKNHYAAAFDGLSAEGLYLQHTGKLLNVMGNYEGSNSLLSLASYFYNDPFTYVTMGDNYKHLEKFDKAEEAYKTAANIIPHRLHPGYLLAHMYYSQEERTKAANLAKELLNKDIKIKSPAIEQMLYDLKVLAALK